MILVVLNPISGGTDKSEIEQLLERWRKDLDTPLTLFKTSGNDDERKIEQRIKDQPVKTLVAVGGDGTVLLCAKLCAQYQCDLLIVPSGSANGMARELALPEDPAEALQLYHSGPAKDLDLLCFDGERWGLHISDLGLNAALVHRYEESDSRGMMTYAQGLLQEMKDLKPKSFEIWIDDEPVRQVEGHMVALANGRHYGTGATLNQVGRPDDGRFEVCVLHRIQAGKIAGHFLDLIGGDDEHLSVWSARKARLKVKEALDFQIDGEWQGKKKELQVEVQPRALKVYRA